MKEEKPSRKARAVVPVSHMKSTTIYVGLDDKILYRKLGENLERMEGAGRWVKVEMSFGFLETKKFREY